MVYGNLVGERGRQAVTLLSIKYGGMPNMISKYSKIFLIILVNSLFYLFCAFRVTDANNVYIILRYTVLMSSNVIFKLTGSQIRTGGKIN